MKPKRRLLWHLYPSYLLITLIALLAVSWYSLSFMRHFFLGQVAEDLAVRARFFEIQILPFLSPVQEETVDRLCKHTGGLVNTRLTVMLPSGRVIADSEKDAAQMDNHSRRPEIAAALREEIGHATRYSRTLDQEMMYVAMPVRQNGKTVAVIRASMPVTTIDSQLARIRAGIAIGGILVAFLAALVSLAVSRRISRPVEEMKLGAEHFSQGHLNFRLSGAGSAEMSSLARAMNQMAGQLDERIHTIMRQRNELEAVLASMTEGVIAIDNEAQLISINAAAGRMFGSSPGQAQGRGLEEIVRNAQLQKFVQKTLVDQEPMESDLMVHMDSQRIFHIRSTPLRDASDRPIGTLLVLNDVTQLRRLENMRRDFAANVSHELRTPLTAIKGFVETLQHGGCDSMEKSQRFLEIISRHVNRLEATIEDLLALSRLEKETEKHEIALKPTRLFPVIQNAIEICRAKAAGKLVRLEFAGEKDIAALLNPTLMEKAVVNLLDNAIKYSDKGSAVQVAAVRGKGDVLIRCTDRGIGIAAEHLPRLFERFYRADKARSREKGGTGLGLAIVKHIVQAHGGHVVVESVLGQGSTFTIHLPLAGDFRLPASQNESI